LGRGNLSVSGVCMIQLESEDEARALQRYFELWDEYTAHVEPTAAGAEPTPPLPALSLRDLLAAIRRRPAMYLGHASVTLLAAFLRGYETALQGSHVSAEEVPDSDDFSRWLSTRYGMGKNYRWDRLLLFHHRDEAAALAEFFKDYSEYEASRDSTP